MTLAQCQAYAQRQATSQNIKLTIWNLNQFNPLYVVRNANPNDSAKHGFVETVKPMTVQS